MIYNETLNVSLSDYKCNSCTLYIVLFVVFLVTSTVISIVFIYFYWYSKKIPNFYLIFASTDKNKEALENYAELWDGIKDQIETISGNKPIEYNKDFIKIRFESDDDLPLGKILNIALCVIVVRSVFQEDNNYYPQV